MAAAYPKREKYFAHRFVRLTHKECLAQRIGTDAAFLLSVIAFQEDACRYKRPVSFYTNQLLPICGFAKWDRLDRARKAAVEAGWLSYEEGGHRKPGTYFVTIPEGLEDTPDTAIDEGDETVFDTRKGNQKQEIRHPETDTKTGINEESISLSGYQQGYQSGVNRGINRVSRGGTTIPIPNPFPFPEGERERGSPPLEVSENEPDLGQGPFPLPSPELIQEVLDTWNACPNVNKSKFLTEPRRRLLMTRLRDPNFANHWREVLAKIASSEFFADGYRPGFDFLLDEEKFIRTLEGNYDRRIRAGPRGVSAKEDKYDESWIDDITEADLERLS